MNSNNKKQAKDRILGDEWESWDGSTNNYLEIYQSKKRTFLSIFMIEFLLFMTFLWLFFYLISPRLIMLNIYSYGLTLFIALTLCMFFLLFLLLSTVILKTKVLINYVQYLLIFNSWLTILLGKCLKIDRDKLLTSYISIHNHVTNIKLEKFRTTKLLILLPRCLTKEIITKIKNSINETEISLHIVSGGEAARKIVKKVSPELIVAIACERDLFSGLMDIALKIPVLGINNLRPVGPCKNTTIDIDFFNEVLSLYYQKS